jgi:hypothetical protein
MKNIESQLNDIIESAVEQMKAVCHAALVAGADRGFGSRSPIRRSTTLPRAAPRAMAPRRSPEQITELAERFLEVVQAEPGQTMSALAPRLDLPPVQLQVPIAYLKKAGKLKTAGQRNFRRYFPAGDAVVGE